MCTEEFYSALSSIITGPLSFLFVVILTLEWRFSKRVMRILIPAFLGALSAGCAAYFLIFGVNGSTKLHTAILAIVCFVAFNLFFSRYPVLQILSTYTTACLFTFLSDTVCGILVPQTGILHVAGKIVSFFIAAAFLIGFFRRPMLEVQRELQGRRWLWMMFVPLAMCFVFFYVVQMQGPLYEDPAFRPVVLALCFCSVSVYISFYFVLCSLQKQYKMQSETKVLQVHLSSLKKHAETMKSMSDQMHLMKHDLRHYFQMQSICLENGDMNGMKEALSSMSQHIMDPAASSLLHQYTGQTLIDAVLSYYGDLAETEGIIFQVRLRLPDDLEDTPELAVMLSNALENACNACRGMRPDETREIRVIGGVEGRQFLLEISNTYIGEIHFDGKGRPKACMAGHGYGTQSIVSYGEKHRAQIYYRTENGWFRLRFLMPQRHE